MTLNGALTQRVHDAVMKRQAKKEGSEWRFLCPSHEDHNPSARWNLEKQVWVCDACDAGGGVKDLAQLLGVGVDDYGNGHKAPGCVVTTYEYTDEAGNPAFQVLRYEPGKNGKPKDFKQRRSDGNGHWVWALGKGTYFQNPDGDWLILKEGEPLPKDKPHRTFPECQRFLYRLPALLAADPDAQILIVEGEKDVQNAEKRGFVATTNAQGSGKWRSEYNESLRNRHIVIVPDNDKPGVEHACKVALHLKDLAASIRIVNLSGLETKGDLSDWFKLGHTGEDLNQLIAETPEWDRKSDTLPSYSTPKVAEPSVDILDECPPVLTKPLQIINGTGYAATWAWIQKTVTEYLDQRTKKPVACNQVDKSWECLIIRDDGTIFGPGGTKPLYELGFDVKLIDPPPSNRLWSAPGMKAYRDGYRPNIPDVMTRLASAYDYFLDFSRSIGTQQQMCRFSAVLSISTYFLDAYSVVGYPFMNGEKGSGKTKWLTIWANTSYLGMLITAGGSFAALRDYADYGAALALDDAENLNDPKKCDPDKRALLLAGNRRGLQIPLKEQVKDRWQTRWVNVYAPRAFSAIGNPDDVLYSRSILIPLVKTGDRNRANRDPGKLAGWPTDVGKIKDDLWAMALWLLPEAEQVFAELDAEPEAMGRDLEPWRASLATARVLERHGAVGLEEDVRQIMRSYFEERAESVTGDRNRAVALAIVKHVESELRKAIGVDTLSDVSDFADVRTFCMAGWTFTATDISNQLKELAKEESEEFDSDSEAASWATAKAVGWHLKRLRVSKDQPLDKKRTPDKKRTKKRHVTLADVQSLAAAFRIQSRLMEVLPPEIQNVRTSETSEMSVSGDTGDTPMPEARDGDACTDCGEPLSEDEKYQCESCRLAWLASEAIT